MSTAGTPPLAAAFIAATLLALAGCTPAPRDTRAGAMEPGVYFHNDIVIFTGIGGGFNSR